VRSAVVLALVLAATLTFPPSTSTSPFFAADFESGNTRGFEDVQAESADRVRAVRSPAAFSGRYSARFEVRPGDEAADGNRAEVTGPSFSEGQTVWFRQAIRIDSTSALEDEWQQVVQYSANGEDSPAVALFTDSEPGGRFRFELGAGDSSEIFWRSPLLKRGVWYDVVAQIHFSALETGQVSVHLDGRPQTLTNGARQLSAVTIDHGRAYYKTGIYRSPDFSGVSLVYHDRILMGTSAAAVGLLN
jgi:peptide/nickel transport system ATP-binding protein